MARVEIRTPSTTASLTDLLDEAVGDDEGATMLDAMILAQGHLGQIVWEVVHEGHALGTSKASDQRVALYLRHSVDGSAAKVHAWLRGGDAE